MYLWVWMQRIKVVLVYVHVPESAVCFTSYSCSPFSNSLLVIYNHHTQMHLASVSYIRLCMSGTGTCTHTNTNAEQWSNVLDLDAGTQQDKSHFLILLSLQTIKGQTVKRKKEKQRSITQVSIVQNWNKSQKPCYWY